MPEEIKISWLAQFNFWQQACESLWKLRSTEFKKNLMYR